MKRIILFFVAMCLLCAGSFAQGNSTKLPIYADLGGGVLKSDGTYATSFPATVTLAGQWADIRLWRAPFSVTEYPAFRVRLQRGFEDEGILQLFARNDYEAGQYGGPYIPFGSNVVKIEGDFVDFDEDGTYDDDPVITEFAIQYTHSDGNITFTVRDAVIYDEDGNEIPSRNIKNDSWKPSDTWVEPDPVYDASVKFEHKGVVGPYSYPVARGKGHVYKFKTAAPIPEGFTLICVLDDGDYTTLVYPMPAGVTEYTSPAITEDYMRLYLEFEGDYPTTVHFTEISYQEIAATGIESILKDAGVQKREYFSPSGMLLDSPAKGINIVRDQMADGTVRTHKIMN